MSNYFMIEYRKKTLVPKENSKRRCYNGCFPSDDWEYGWTNWDWLSLKLDEEQAQGKLAFWKDLNEIAVRERGPSAEQEYRISVDTVYDGTW